MRASSTTITLILMIVMPCALFAQGPKNFIDQNYIEVQGTAVVKVVPDLIYLRIRIAEKQKNKAELEIKETKMLSAFSKIGIESKDIAVIDMASNFRQVLFSDDNIVLTKEYLVCVHDVKTANRVISDMENLEISNIRVDRLDHTRLTDFKKECGVKAMVAAKAKAEGLTVAINQSIGRALFIQELTNNAMDMMQGGNVIFKSEKVADQSWNASDLAFDEIKLECTILAYFELKPGSHN